MDPKKDPRLWILGRIPELGPEDGGGSVHGFEEGRIPEHGIEEGKAPEYGIEEERGPDHGIEEGPPSMNSRNSGQRYLQCLFYKGDGYL